jgi:hypothetical protein
MDPRTEHKLEVLRAAAAPEVRRFVDWVANELCDRLELKIHELGLPPDLARRVAADTVRLVARDVLATAKRYHELKDAPYVGKPPWE